MKLVAVTFTLLFFIVACSSTQDKNESKQTDYKLEINNLLDKWHKDAADTNLEDYFSLMHEDFVFIGTDGTEYWNKTEFRKFCTPYFEQGQAWDFKTLKRNIYISSDKNTVWFDEVLEAGLGPCRGSGVFEKVDGKWFIQQYVLSMLVPNEDVKEVLEVKRVEDSAFLVKL